MKTIIAVGGEPATGKTTLMKNLIQMIKEDRNESDVFGPVADLINAHYWKNPDVYVLGKYEKGQVFSGTDTFSMAVQPKVMPWLKSLPDHSVVIFEGDRLFNQSMLTEIVEQDEEMYLRGFILTASNDVLKKRHQNRGDNQSDQFKKGRATKYIGIEMNMFLQSVIDSVPNETPEQAFNLLNQIMTLVKEAPNL